MVKIIKCPGKYVQGKGVINKINEYASALGNSFFILLSENSYNRMAENIKTGFEDPVSSLYFSIFKGECTLSEINRLTEECKKIGCDVVIAIGGGKAIDTAKIVADNISIPLVVIPTIASNDAPCTGLSVIYSEDGMAVKTIYTKKNPDLVLVDSEIISKAPARFFISGMGDALSTYFEARASYASNALTSAKGQATKTALMMARLCFDILMQDGLHAKIAVENKAVTKALENVLEASIYLSAIGFESGGLAVAHSVYYGMYHIEESKHFLHGEKVAFGTIVQLILEKAPKEELEQVLHFCMSVGLPVSLDQLGVYNIKPDIIEKVALTACDVKRSTKNMPFEVTAQDLFDSILVADTVGKKYRQSYTLNKK